MKLKGTRIIRMIDGEEKTMVMISESQYNYANSKFVLLQARLKKAHQTRQYYNRVIKARIKKIDLLLEKLTK